MIVSGFDWGDGNSKKCRKHGVDLEDMEYVFKRGPLVAPDAKHSEEEDRFIAIGPDRNQRLMFIGFTFRVRQERRLIRPISARYMHRKEIEAYEAGSQADD